ncbi:Zinc finger protein MAGPIE-like protein [Glycine soja]|nr:Zinc finger protein MAGPIE-like protein [Glycine soja]
MTVDLDNASTASGEAASVSSSGNQTKPAAPKKKRNLPGMPDPEAEVIALSPKTLLATNRFVCEICNKGFQRDQNLQLHRRGHNLPWKLRQRSSKEKARREEVETATTTTTTTITSTTQANSVMSSCLQTHNLDLPENNPPQVIEEPQAATATAISGSCGSSSSCSTSNGGATCNSNSSSSVFASLFASSTASVTLQSQTPAFSDLIRAMGPPEHPADQISGPSSEAISLCLSTTSASPIFATGGRQYASSSPHPAMSATALLQKAAQMGAAATNASLLRGLGIVSSSPLDSTSSGQQNVLQWGHQQQLEPESGSVAAAGLGLGLPCEDGGSGLKELMMGTSSMFGPKHTTLDFLGLGMAAGGTAGGGLSALITSIGGGLDVTAAFGNGDFSGKDIGSSS